MGVNSMFNKWEKDRQSPEQMTIARTLAFPATTGEYTCCFPFFPMMDASCKHLVFLREFLVFMTLLIIIIDLRNR